MSPFTLPSAALVVAALALPAAQPAAQGFIKPSPQLQKYAPMIGTWQGSGKVRHGPGVGEDDWTARSSVRWILGGLAVRDDSTIKMASMPQPLCMTTVYTWDNERRRHVAIGVNNLGDVSMKEVHWTADDKMITGGTKVWMGTPVVERWITAFVGDGEMTFVGEEAQGSGPFFEHVTGSMQRTAAEPAAMELPQTPFVPEMVAAIKAEVGKLASTVGEYRMKGWWRGGPDAPKTDFTGSESVRAIFDGCALAMISKGDPTDGMPAYEGLGWMGWSEADGCYLAAYLNNMGEVSVMECSLVDGKLIGTTATRLMGQLACMRGVTVLGDDGFVEHTGHMMLGASEPVQVFAATYEKQ